MQPESVWAVCFPKSQRGPGARDLVESLVGEFRRMHATSFPTMVRVWIGSGYPEFEPGGEIEPFDWPSSS